MRVILWILAVPVILIVLAAVLIPLFLDEKALVDIVAKQLKDESGAVLRVDGDASLSLFPKVALSASDVSLEVPESNTQIVAKSLSAGVALMPLLSSSVEIDSIQVQGLTVTSEAADEEAAKAEATDTSTLSNAELEKFYALRAQARVKAQAEAAATVLAAPLALEVGELSLSNIRLITVDSAGIAISELQLRQLTASDLNLDGRVVPLTGDIIIPSGTDAPPMEITLAGEFRTDLDAETLNLDSLNIRVTGTTPDAITLGLSGEFSLDTQVADLNIELQTGDLTGSGTLRYASFESPQIDADLALTELNPALLILAGPDASAEGAQDAASSDGDAPLPLNALRMIDTRAKLRIDTVVLDAHKLTDVSAALRMVDGVATLDPVSAQVHGGDINFSAVFNGRYNVATLATEGGVEALDVAQAVSAMELGMEARGAANLEWSLSGSGASSNALTQSLTGPISFTTQDITLAGIGMEQMFCKGVALVNQEALSAEFPADTRFEALEAEIMLTDGVATLNPLTAQLAAVGLNGNGTLDLDSQDLRASFRAQLSAALGELDPACRINERYSDLRWPVECKGNLADDPAGWCGVNTSEIIKDLAEGELKRKASDEAGKLFNKLFRRD
ncbi:AsmA family protein [Congregibacter brevis]|uniref:AsmA family protein n=1 Tax=Congregibacter brevis TaxID=3081201 RepID=A0ABZ0IF55_9GAMM|nr:AsmA family protein [Congregibacter sp. IMCC45268]